MQIFCLERRKSPRLTDKKERKLKPIIFRLRNWFSLLLNAQDVSLSSRTCTLWLPFIASRPVSLYTEGQWGWNKFLFLHFYCTRLKSFFSLFSLSFKWRVKDIKSWRKVASTLSTNKQLFVTCKFDCRTVVFMNQGQRVHKLAQHICVFVHCMQVRGSLVICKQTRQAPRSVTSYKAATFSLLNCSKAPAENSRSNIAEG